MFPTYRLLSCCSENVVAEDIPADMEALVAEKRRELIEAVSEVDDKLAEPFLNDEPITSTDLEVCQHAF
jgi:elongation factor G